VLPKPGILKHQVAYAIGTGAIHNINLALTRLQAERTVHGEPHSQLRDVAHSRGLLTRIALTHTVH